MLAVAAAFGPVAVTRAGIAVALATAVLGCVFAWRELFAAERGHARSTLEASRRHGAQLREERGRNAAVVSELGARVQRASAVVADQRATLGALRDEVVALEDDRTLLRADLRQRDAVISVLRGTVRAQHREISTLEEQLRGRDAYDPSEVRHLPRRVRAELEATALQPEALDRQMLGTAFPVAVLSNYEEDRRPA